VNFTDYIKKTYPDVEVIFNINNTFNVDVLEDVLNMEFFNSFFNKFNILNGNNVKLPWSGNGVIEYENEKFKRLYSGRNGDPLNNIPGCFDVYAQESNYEYFKNLNIPYYDFTFNDIDDRVKDFDVFNKNVIERADKFVNEKFNNNDFYSIHYRAYPNLYDDKINNFKEKLINILDPNKKYFVTSNSPKAKEILLDLPYDIIPYRTLSEHKNTPVGHYIDSDAKEEGMIGVTELLILSKSKHIYHSGDINWVSLFTWYACNVKKVELTNF
jgi:hypothetical protein